MDPRAIDRFFRFLAQEYGRSAKVIVTGAAAGSLWGHVRPSRDIDFAVTLASRQSALWNAFQAAVDRASRQAGIQVNYAEDIDRWSSIALLDWRRHTTRYRRFGKLEVRLLDPVHWSIGKLSRYYELDAYDLVAVLRRQRPPLLRVLQVWARALRASPRSPAVFQFRTQVEHFLRAHGREVWGRRFDGEAAIRQFHRQAGIRAKHARTPA